MAAEIREPESELSTRELVQHAITEAKLLARAEIEHARLELKAELREARTAAIAFGVGAVLALCGLAVLFVALALVLPMSDAAGALLVGIVLLIVAGIAALVGARRVPKKPMERTRERLLSDVKLTRERFA
ncbi:MAG: phage holin family protein [Myxococcaceae bacterium]|nr:phage holin family protein [Myxococcaceae bacterium]